MKKNDNQHYIESSEIKRLLFNCLKLKLEHMKIQKKNAENNALHLISVKNNNLFFDGLDINDFAKNNETPLYIFSERAIIMNYLKLKQAFSAWEKGESRVAYSIKNNFTPAIINILKIGGSMFEISSEDEMRLLRKFGIPLNECIFTGIWKSNETIEYAIRNEIGYLVLDSFNDLEKVNKVAKTLSSKVKVLLRINPRINMKDSAFASAVNWSKTGFLIANQKQNYLESQNIFDFIQLVLNCRNVIFSGLHAHLGSQITNINHFDDFSNQICDLYLKIQKKFKIKLETLDLGGGYPVSLNKNYVVPSIDQIAGVIINNLNLHNITTNLIIESGRYITSSAGILVTKIVAIKETYSDAKIVIINASAYNELLDSILVHWPYEMTIANKASGDKNVKVIVAGETADSIDMFDQIRVNGEQERLIVRKPVPRFLQNPEEGDALIVLGAGAYTTCFNMNYCLRPKPAIYMINKNGKVKIVRRKERLEDILAYYQTEPFI